MTTLRDDLMRLAAEHPELRRHVVPILRKYTATNPNMWVYRIQGDKVPRSVSRHEDLSWDEAKSLAEKYEAQGGWVDLEKSPDGNPPWMSVDSYEWSKNASAPKYKAIAKEVYDALAGTGLFENLVNRMSTDEPPVDGWAEFFQDRDDVMNAIHAATEKALKKPKHKSLAGDEDVYPEVVTYVTEMFVKDAGQEY